VTRILNLFDPNPPPETVGVMFVDDGTPYDPAGTRPPLTDDEHAAWMLHHHGPEAADRLADMHKAIATGAPGWHRRRGSGYLHHAIRQADGHTSIIVWDPTGWAWQVWRHGDHNPARPIQGPPAATAAEAVRLADEFVADANRRKGRR